MGSLDIVRGGKRNTAEYDGSLTPEQLDAKHVAEIIIAFTNPHMYGHGIRFRDKYISQRTGTYYTWEKPTSAENWTQQVVKMLATPTSPFPNRTPVNTITNWIFRQALRRYIREDKNPSAATCCMQWFTTQGSDSFLVDCPDALQGSLNELEVGGAVYAPNYAATNASPASPLYAAAPFNTATAAQVTALKAMHSNWMTAFTWKNKTYIYCDGCSLSSALTSATGIIYVDGVGTTVTPAATPAGTTPATYASPSVANTVLCGVLVIAQGPIRVPTGALFQFAIHAYNEGQEYEVYGGVTGKVTNATAQGNALVAYPLTLPDYYRVRFACAGTTTSTGASIATVAGDNASKTVQIYTINSGEFYRHLMTPDFALNFSTIQNHRGFGSSLLSTNTTPDQYKGGSCVSCQPALGTEWQEVVDGGDPYDYLTTQLQETDLSFVKGHYNWLRVSSANDLGWQREIIENSTPTAGIVGTQVSSFALRTELFNQAWMAQTISAPPGSPQNVAWSFDFNGEYTTLNRFQETLLSRFSPEQWEKAIDVMATMQQSFENETHNQKLQEAVIMSVGSKEGANRGTSWQKLYDAVVRWSPHILSLGKALAPVVMAATAGRR